MTTDTPILHRLGIVGSTMNEARELAASGAPNLSAVTAVQQAAGRGRDGRQWLSPPGNLYLTAVLRPGGDVQRAPQLAFVVAVAVAEAADRLAGPGTALKWPNDVLRRGAKLAGILLERQDSGAVLAGIGMNVAGAPEGMPYAVTSLRAEGSAASVDDAADAVLEALRAEWARWEADGFTATLRRWQARGPAPGAALSVRQGDTRMAGRFAGLRADGALLLDTADGRRTIVAGDVQPCETRQNGTKTTSC